LFLRKQLRELAPQQAPKSINGHSGRISKSFGGSSVDER
jgi:hypothetical protein